MVSSSQLLLPYLVYLPSFPKVSPAIATLVWLKSSRYHYSLMVNGPIKAAGLTGDLLYKACNLFLSLSLQFWYSTSAFNWRQAITREDEIAAESMGVNVTKWRFLFLLLLVPWFQRLLVLPLCQLHRYWCRATKDFTIMKSIDYLITLFLVVLDLSRYYHCCCWVLGIIKMFLQTFQTFCMIIYASGFDSCNALPSRWTSGTKELYLSKFSINLRSGQIKMALLEVKNLTKNFGGLTAVGASMELNEGELEAYRTKWCW